MSEIRAEMAARAGSIRPSSHRGTRATPTDAEVADGLRALADSGELAGADGAYWLPGWTPGFGADMDRRISALIEALVAGSVEPPPTSVAARDAGVPPSVVDQLRQAGWLVEIGPRIEYPRATIDALLAAVEAARMETGDVDRGLLRARTGLSHRRADALLDWLARASLPPSGG